MGGTLNLDALDILLILKSLDLCTNLEAPKQRSDLTFDEVLSAFLKGMYQKGKSLIETLPLPAIVGEGCQVDLLRLFCIVRERGGYFSVMTSWSWGDVAELVGLGPNLGPLVKLVYVKYLSTLESWVQRVTDKKTEPALNKGSFYLLKRKRDSTVEMLHLVRDLAKRPCDHLNNIVPVSKEAHNGGKQNMIVDYFKLAILIRSEIFFKKIRIDSSLLPSTMKKVVYASSSNSKNKRTTLVTPNKIITKNPKNNPTISPPFSWFSIEEKSDIPVGPNHQAIIPVFTKNKSHLDPDALKYFGTHICPLDDSCQFSNVYPQKDKMGRKSCGCLIPNSIDCVRFHIDENRLNLKRELGHVFYKMGFHKIGEEISLFWEEEEEEKFKIVIRENSPNENFNFWDPLKINFKYKGCRSLVNYYFNVFIVRRRAYQNRMVPDATNSDDDEMEPGFLDSTLFCIQNSQCMDLDP